MEIACDEDGKIVFVDLSHTLNPNIPSHPAVNASKFRMRVLKTVGNDSLFKIERIKTLTHIGTHVDAPSHVSISGWNVSDIPLQRFIAPAVVVDIRHKTYKNPDAQLTSEDLIFWEKENGKIPPGSVLLVLTGWDRFWNNEKMYFGTDDNGNLHFPTLSTDAAEWIIQKRNIYGVGIDTPSFDTKPTFAVHRILLDHSLYLIENLTNLNRLPKTRITLYVMPLKIDGASGAPARVLAVFIK